MFGFEWHVTIEPTENGDRTLLKDAIERLGIKYSCIYGDLLLGDRLLCYATGHAETFKTAEKQMNFTAHQLDLMTFKVLRRKIELIVYDEKGA